MPSISYLELSSSMHSGGAKTEDGYLYLRELATLDLEVELLVMAACETGAGTPLSLEGVQSLSLAGLTSGARSVVASLWKVGDRQSRVLLSRFYRKWIGEGMSRIQALSDTKRNAITDGVPMRSWSAYVLWDAEV